MARKRRLDPYVSVFVDRHHKERFRFRRDGFSCYLPAPTDKGYKAAYQAALEGTVERQSRCAPMSTDDLVTRYYRAARFTKLSDGRRAAIRRFMEPFREEFRNDDVRHFRFEHIEVVLARKAMKRKDGKRTVGGASAASRLRDELTRLFEYAIKLRWRTDNPAAQAELPATHSRVGFHSWTEEEIAQFQKKHPLGTKARLALEIMLWTGLRRSDTVKLGPQNIKRGRIQTTATKTGKTVDVVAAPDLLAAIKAMPAVGLTTLLVTEYGKPFSVAGFGNWFRDRCNEAGLPHCTAHGLRKALARRAADLGATQRQLKAVGQWSSDRDVAVYTAGAEDRALADAALQLVIRDHEQDANNV
jgi:integrase